MIRFGLYVALICVAFKLTEGIHIKEVFVINSTDSKIVEDLTFDTDVGKSSPKADDDSGIIELKYIGRKHGKKRPGSTVKDHKKLKTARHHRHLRRRCCEGGELAAKHGLSCIIPRNFKNMFFNLVTQTRQKYQGTLSQRSKPHSRFRSKTVYSIYHTISKCVKRQKKSVVQKCCLAYLKKTHRKQWG